MIKNNALWMRIQQDDSLAFKELFKLHYKPLCTYALQFTQRMPDAEDLVQSAFIKLWAKRKELTIKTSTKAYLYRSVYNLYMDLYRKHKKQDLFFEKLKYEALALEQPDDEEEELNRKVTKLKSIVDGLPVRCKEILLLSKWEEYKHLEIAEKLDISVKTVETQLRIAFHKIRKGFDKNNQLFLFFLKWIYFL